MDKNIEELLKGAKPWGIVLILSSLIAFIIWQVLGNESQLLMLFMSIVLGTGIVFIVYVIFIIIHLITIKSGKVTAKIERKAKQLDKTDFEKNKDYYREILNINSPLIIGYLDDFEIDKNKLIAELLYLKKKKYIDVKDGKIEKISNQDKHNLNDLDIKILDNIQEGKLKIRNVIKLREEVASKVEKNNLVKKIRNIFNNKKKWKMGFWITSIILGVLVSNLVVPNDTALNNYENGYMTLWDFIFGRACIDFSFCLISALVIYILVKVFKEEYLNIRGILYKRTSKGRELNQKLEGLKNYLKDYSLMDEREAKEIELWDDYLIYSVMFGQNKKIIEEYEKYIEIIE